MSKAFPVRRAGVLGAVIIAAFALLVVLQAPAQAAGSQVLRIAARSHMVLRFNVSHLSAHAGRVTIVMTNPGNAGMRHGVAISGNGVNMAGKIVGPGKTSTVTVTLHRGTYTFFCPVPGHKAAGMKGTLTVS
jgi:uncharacterized cupredoxin-like copper-binding protein